MSRRFLLNPNARQSVPARFHSEKTLVKPLTERERQILVRLNSGHSPDEISVDLSVSTSTVRSHIKRVYAKLDVHSRYEAVDRAQELGLR